MDGPSRGKFLTTNKGPLNAIDFYCITPEMGIGNLPAEKALLDRLMGRWEGRRIGEKPKVKGASNMLVPWTDPHVEDRYTQPSY